MIGGVGLAMGMWMLAKERSAKWRLLPVFGLPEARTKHQSAFIGFSESCVDCQFYVLLDSASHAFATQPHDGRVVGL